MSGGLKFVLIALAVLGTNLGFRSPNASRRIDRVTRPTSHRKKALDREDPLLYVALNNERAHK
jgi:hypothetical protein